MGRILSRSISNKYAVILSEKPIKNLKNKIHTEFQNTKNVIKSKFYIERPHQKKFLGKNRYSVVNTISALVPLFSKCSFKSKYFLWQQGERLEKIIGKKLGGFQVSLLFNCLIFEAPRASSKIPQRRLKKVGN